MKRRGRPIKPVTGKRAQITTLIRADLKRRLMNDAKQNGRTLSQEVEHALERLFAYESLTSALANFQPAKGDSLLDLQKTLASLVPSSPRAVQPPGGPSPRPVRPPGGPSPRAISIQDGPQGEPEDDENSKP